MILPRPLPPGGTIGLCAPAGPVDTDRLDAAIALIRSRGYHVVEAPHTRDRNAGLVYLAGADEARLSDLNGLLRDSSVDLILCARGGYGTMRLLDGVDYEAARADPKSMVGYSDITALQLALAARAGVVSFSGPLATAGHGLGEPTLDRWSEVSLWSAVGEGPRPRILESPRLNPPWHVLRSGGTSGSGVVAGPVYPVCLSLLVALLGTPFVPDLGGAILVIEDVEEKLYHVDRFLTQLRLAGILEGLSAILVGSFNGTDDDEDLRRGVPLLARDLAPPSVAVASGVAYGHIPRRLTLPVGAWAEVDLRRGTFSF